jgi:hypothetical protein
MVAQQAETRGKAWRGHIEESMADFIALEAELLGARQVFLGHHDNWMPPITRTSFDMAPVREELTRRSPQATLIETGYLAGSVLVE